MIVNVVCPYCGTMFGFAIDKDQGLHKQNYLCRCPKPEEGGCWGDFIATIELTASVECQAIKNNFSAVNE